jgi:hypothetical protein
MVMRWVLAMAACGLIGAGCGDDSGDDTPKAGTSTNTAGKSGGMAGSGMAGSAGGNSSSANVMMAISGACEMKEELMMCMGVDAFTACAYDDCGGQACADGGCKAWADCVAAAGDPCMNNCTRSAACDTCGDAVYKCVIDKCLDKLDCSK